MEFLGWFDDNDSIFLAMEYFANGVLKKYITGQIQEQDAKIISVQLIRGLEIMHREGFTHRDLKPEVS